MGFREMRKKAGLTQVEAGKLIGVSGAAITQWETGVTMPNAKRLPVVAAVYGCSVNDLLAEEPAKEP